MSPRLARPLRTARTQLRHACVGLSCALVSALPLAAQDRDRVWGRVHTVDGAVHEGFLRWDRNEGSWVDILDGSKELPRENYLVWLEGTDGERAERVVEVLGYRVSWEEEHPDFSLTSRSGVRFGHISSLEVAGRNRLSVTLRSGTTLELSGGASDIGPALRRLVVDGPGEDEVSLRWRELQRIDLTAPPEGARASSRRLHGTVEDERGRHFTGYVAWDLDEILESDVLDGEEVRGGRDHEIPFGEIAEISKIDDDASRITLTDGRTLDLTDSNDVDEDNSGIQISDPDLGTVRLDWEEFRSVRFHPRAEPVTYEDFDGGRPLRGVVTTADGEEITGVLRWDADEEATWEMLDGRDDGSFAIELANVRTIERSEGLGVIVTLRDGRIFELFDERDVDLDNKGIMVAPEGSDLTRVRSWRLVPWDDFRAVRLGDGS